MEDQKPASESIVIDKKELESRLAELKQARDSAAANLQAISGAIQQVELFIKEISDREAAAIKQSAGKEVPGIKDKKPAISEAKKAPK